MSHNETGICKEYCGIIDYIASLQIEPIWLTSVQVKNIKSIGLINNDTTYMVCEHLNRLQYLSVHLVGIAHQQERAR